MAFKLCETVSKGYLLIDSGFLVDGMFSIGAKIYLTHHLDVYLSEYFNGEDLRKKNLLCLFNRAGEERSYMMISNEMINNDCDFTIKTIDDFAVKMGLDKIFNEISDAAHVTIEERIALISYLK